MKRGSFTDEFGSVVNYTVIVLMVVVLFFVCFAFSRKDAATSGIPGGKPGFSDDTGEETPEEIPDQLPEETPDQLPEETPGQEPEETPGAEPEPETITSSDGTVFVVVNDSVYAVENVRLRTEPNTASPIAAILYTGQGVPRSGISDAGWSRVEYNGNVVYVATEFVTTTAP